MWGPLRSAIVRRHGRRKRNETARFIKAGHDERADGKDAPGARQRRKLLVGPSALHCQHPGCRARKAGDGAQKLRQRCKGARHYGIEGRIGRELLRACLQRLDVGESQHARGVRDEADLLTVRVDEREASLRLYEGERQTWKSGAGSHIGNPSSDEVSVDRKAVEQMMREHLVLGFDRGEIKRTVPALKLIEERDETRAIPGSQSDPQCCGIAFQALE